MIRVLMVEDDPVIRDTTRYFLQSQQNFEVVCAETGGDALSHAREKFDVILMDILLPDTNGVDLCQRLRSWHHCPIIFTSCLDDTDTVVRALEMGGDDFLQSPIITKCCWPASWPTSAGCRWTQPSPMSMVITARLLRWTPTAGQCGARRPEHPPGRYGVPHPLAVCPVPQHVLYRRRALPEDLGQGQPGGCAHRAGAHPQPARNIEPDPAKPVYLKNVWGKGYIFQPEGRAAD